MTEEIKTIIIGVVSSIGAVCDEVKIVTEDGGVVWFRVQTKDSRLLIGHQGQNFSALNHVIKKIIAKRFPDAQFVFDINDYQKQNIDSVKNKALLMAERARSFQASIEMEPMSSYERMIVHSTLAEVPDILTESFGDGEARHVVIKYKQVI